MSEVGFYLGIRVEVVEDLGGGWCRCRWANGKLYRQWRAQVKQSPWGDA